MFSKTGYIPVTCLWFVGTFLLQQDCCHLFGNPLRLEFFQSNFLDSHFLHDVMAESPLCFCRMMQHFQKKVGRVFGGVAN